MLIDFTNITDYIPHREPFLMIDRLKMVSEDIFEGYYTIKSSNPLTDGSYVSQSIMTEFFAQTGAAGFGYLTRNRKVSQGFIGAIKNLQVYKYPSLGNTLTSRVLVKNRFENIQLIEGKVMLKGETILECKMKVVSP